MSYSVYVQKFEKGAPSPAPYPQVVAVLQKYGTVTGVESRLEFTPVGNDLCEIGFLGGTESDGIDSIGFERPISNGRLAALVFDLLAVKGMCYFELDCTYVLARSDVTSDLPQGLLELCSSGRVTVISSAREIPL